MKLITPVNITKSHLKLNQQNAITLIGSCFSQNIGDKLAYHKFNINPIFFGTVFNPISICNNLNLLITKQLYTEKDFYNFENKKVVNFNNQFVSFNKNLDKIISEQNIELEKEIKHFNESKTLIITFGTAWIYEFKQTGKIVANCHKIPQNNFTKRLLKVDEIVDAYSNILKQLTHLNIIFTVSPVRHTKDGLHENNLSKATLHLAINTLTEQFKNCNYFPAYELVIDELRDYRFFKDDLVHPSEMAVNYVWKKFGETYFSEETLQLNEQIDKIQKALNHKPFNLESEEYGKFKTNLNEQLNKLNKEYPFIVFD